jgi:hypothetical protein
MGEDLVAMKYTFSGHEVERVGFGGKVLSQNPKTEEKLIPYWQDIMLGDVGR